MANDKRTLLLTNRNFESPPMKQNWLKISTTDCVTPNTRCIESKYLIIVRLFSSPSSGLESPTYSNFFKSSWSYLLLYPHVQCPPKSMAFIIAPVHLFQNRKKRRYKLYDKVKSPSNTYTARAILIIEFSPKFLVIFLASLHIIMKLCIKLFRANLWWWDCEQTMPLQ